MSTDHLEHVVPCTSCGERWCTLCDHHWAVCSCPGPHAYDIRLKETRAWVDTARAIRASAQQARDRAQGALVDAQREVAAAELELAHLEGADSAP
jgi:hypothetical protein